MTTLDPRILAGRWVDEHLRFLFLVRGADNKVYPCVPGEHEGKYFLTTPPFEAGQPPLLIDGCTKAQLLEALREVPTPELYLEGVRRRL